MAIIGRKHNADSSIALPCCFFRRSDIAIIVKPPKLNCRWYCQYGV
jgi:hypothetical protein